MTKIITTSFGPKFHGAVERLGKQIENLESGYVFGVITESTLYQERQLLSLKKFFKDNDELRNSSKGFFWYIWKPWVLLRTIIDLEENDVFVYLDAGTEISINGKNNLHNLIEDAKLFGTFFFRNPQKIKDFTKTSTLDFFNENNINIELNQVAAGILFLRNDFETRKLLREWCKLSLFNNGDLFDDKGFSNHRHDQSILSLIIQKYKFNIVDYPIWFSDLDYLSTELTSYPIHTLRNSSNVSLLSLIKIFNRVPSKFWLYSEFSCSLYRYTKKTLFFLKRKLSRNVIWDEKWNMIWDLNVDHQFKNYYHRTAGDFRDTLVIKKYNYNLKFLTRHIIINNVGVYKDLDTNVVYYNQFKQFGKITYNANFQSENKKLEGNHVILLSLNDNNIFHFIYDLLYKALYLKELGFSFVCVIKDNFIWKSDLMNFFGLNYIIVKEKLIEIPKALMINSPVYSGDPSKEVVDILRKSVYHFSFNRDFPKKILIFRRVARTRRIINFEVFLPLIKLHGFSFIELEELTVSEQLELFKNAEVIIAAHGAGLSWLFACSSECVVIELFSKNYLNFLYSRISEKLKLKYYSFICDSDFSRNILDPDIFIPYYIENEIYSILGLKKSI